MSVSRDFIDSYSPEASHPRHRARQGALVHVRAKLTQPLFTSPQPKSDISDFGHFKVPNSGKPEFGWGEVGMGVPCASIPGEGVANPFGVRVPLTRIAQARSDLSPAELGFTRVRHY